MKMAEWTCPYCGGKNDQDVLAGWRCSAPTITKRRKNCAVTAGVQAVMGCMKCGAGWCEHHWIVGGYTPDAPKNPSSYGHSHKIPLMPRGMPPVPPGNLSHLTDPSSWFLDEEATSTPHDCSCDFDSVVMRQGCQCGGE